MDQTNRHTTSEAREHAATEYQRVLRNLAFENQRHRWLSPGDASEVQVAADFIDSPEIIAMLKQLLALRAVRDLGGE